MPAGERDPGSGGTGGLLPAPTTTTGALDLSGNRTSTTSTTGTTSGGGSSGSGTSRAATKRSALATLRRYFINIGLGGGLANWAYGKLRSGYDMEGVLAELYGRPEFKRRFPGIFRKDGSLIVSPQEYIQLTDAYRSIASQYGFKLSAAQIGQAIGNENSAEEFKLKASAIQVINNNPNVVRYMGFKKPAEAVDFVLGKSDRAVYDRYEAGAIRSQLTGFGYGTDDISGGRATVLARQTAGVLDFEDIAQRVSKIRQQVVTAGPELRAQGISQRDLEDIQFGKPTANVLDRVERALNQRQAQIGAGEEAARGYGPQATSIEQGLPTSGYRRQATE